MYRMSDHTAKARAVEAHRDVACKSRGCARAFRLDRAGSHCYLPGVKPTTPYRQLPAERRLSLLTHALRQHRENREAYAQRLVARGGGFRAATLLTWPPERLAREVLRLNAESAQDELELLQLLYVELEPQIQIAFLEAAGVPHTDGVIPDELPAPYAEAPAVEHAAGVVLATHGAEGEHYLRTIARYNAEAWPGIEDVVARLTASQQT